MIINGECRHGPPPQNSDQSQRVSDSQYASRFEQAPAAAVAGGESDSTDTCLQPAGCVVCGAWAGWAAACVRRSLEDHEVERHSLLFGSMPSHKLTDTDTELMTALTVLHD